MDEFNPAAELDNIRAHKKVIRKRIYRASKLDEFEDRILALRSQGASFADIQFWLDEKKDLTVAWSTVQRWFMRNG